MLSKLLKFVKKYQGDIILVSGVALISLLSFTIGCIVSERDRDGKMLFQTKIIDTKTESKTEHQEEK